MNPLIKKQLESCKVAVVPPFMEDTTQLIIPKGTASTVSLFEVGRCYLVELADYITNPPEDFTLSVNWNQGTVPKHKYYKCEINKVMGSMVRIQGCGYILETNTDTCDMWAGWVPQKGIKLLQRLD